MSVFIGNFKKILVIQTAFLGDAVLCIPLLKVIRHFYPEAKLGFVCREGFSSFFLATGLVDQVIEVNKKNPASLKSSYLKTKEFAPDLVLSPHRSFRTALWVFCLRPRLSVGFRGPWSFFFKKRIHYQKSIHDVLRQLSLTDALGISAPQFPKNLLTLSVLIDPGLNFKELPSSDLVALAPGSQWNTKKWTLQGFKEVAKELKAQGKTIIILGSKEEFELGQEIAAEVEGALNYCGKTSILELAQILGRSSLLICNDSGTMHVASTQGIPVVCIFGPTVVSLGYAPWNKRARVVEVDLECRPCGAHGHALCPLGHHACMTQVTSSMVIKQVLEILG